MTDCEKILLNIKKKQLARINDLILSKDNKEKFKKYLERNPNRKMQDIYEEVCHYFSFGILPDEMIYIFNTWVT
ncbi:MAG: hypothetical protein ACXAC2_00535 [Candidatus Kariarchaeaceae archaeon]|jgi:hypothetical protein